MRILIVLVVLFLTALMFRNAHELIQGLNFPAGFACGVFIYALLRKMEFGKWYY